MSASSKDKLAFDETAQPERRGLTRKIRRGRIPALSILGLFIGAIQALVLLGIFDQRSAETPVGYLGIGMAGAVAASGVAIVEGWAILRVRREYAPFAISLIVASVALALVSLVFNILAFVELNRFLD